MTAKVRFRLRLVPPPAPALTMDEKRAKAISYIRGRGKYILDIGTPTPQWGHGLEKQEKAK